MTANTPSTVLSSASSAIVVTPGVYDPSALVRSPRMADVQPFRAVRYSGAAGPLADLVAPPYDAGRARGARALFDRAARTTSST